MIDTTIISDMKSNCNYALGINDREKEKRAAELIIANKGLEQFAYIASHDLREPIRDLLVRAGT